MNNVITVQPNPLIDSNQSFPIEEPHLIFSKVLATIKKADFRHLAGPVFVEDPDRKLTQKHYLICTVEHLLAQAQVNGYALCRRNGIVYLYNRAFWQVTEENEIQDLLSRTSEKMGVDKFNSRHYEFRDRLYRQFLSSSHFPVLPQSPQTVLINMQNGTYEITPDSQRLRPHDKADFLTYQLSFAYQANAKAPIFQRYLDTVLPDTDLQSLLAEYIGYVFIRHLKLEKVLLLYGTGSNGKSVFFEVVNALLGGQNVSNYSLQSLSNEAHRAKLADKLLNYGSEIKGSLESDVFKQLASGEPVEAKLLYRDPFIMRDYAKLMFNCNTLPKEVEHSEAFFRRFLIVPFEVTITDEQKDPELPTKIIQRELSGVFNWILSGMNRLLANKRFTHSEKASQVLAKYRQEADTVAVFLMEENYQPSVSYLSLQSIYEHYKAFCTISGFAFLNLKNFKDRLEKNHIQVKRQTIGNVVYASKPFP
ncbi:DNA primase family protein [Spirosoma endbachense]|uniref:DNA primase n=1 Tax=Spirosoma endbachense TaxID=2666025 RepID=A0A6P1VYJ3_9BACT|nr:phage/plasmid primase, P4 family [Spirosoma endbachense]QHV98281.1 DNA primase [Spirosoma endbachense]